MTLEDIIKDVQRTLQLQEDGKAGPLTWAAIHRKLVKGEAAASLMELAMPPVDSRSEANIATLLAEVQAPARALVQKAAQAGIRIKVISGLRSFAEQDALFAKGRPNDGPIVTKARGGFSNHNFGIAFDVGVFEGNNYLGSSPKYKAVGVLGQELGLEWGGNWKDFVDEPHFQLRPAWAEGMRESSMLAQLRQRVDDGTAVFA